MTQKHKEQWLMDLLKEVKGKIEEKKLALILESRGRTCISAAYVKKKPRTPQRELKTLMNSWTDWVKSCPCLREKAIRSIWSTQNVTAMP